ncbi:hypothetical protein HOC32_06020 [Candidatus Woesearchaeota archaeon]|jgi:hypothetical protein|nr:hypothetical protein [Candidatus Woesearchaeota archaeon]
MNKKINPDTAEILGAFIGDGWIEKSKCSIYITGDRIEDREYYDQFLAPLFSKVFCEVQPKEFLYWKVYGIGCHKKQIIQKCKDLGFQSGRKSLIAKIPTLFIDSNNPEVKKAVLRGIFDADGSIWFDKSRAKTSVAWKKKFHYIPIVEITSCSENLMEQIRTLILGLGIESKLRLKSKAGRRSNRNRHDSFSVKIQKIDHVKKWFQIIGSSNPRHQTRYAVWEMFGFLPPGTNINQRKMMLKGNLDQKSFYEK